MIDINKALLRRDGSGFLTCPECNQQSFGVLVGPFGDAVVVTKLVCLSDKCDGESSFDLNYGRVE